MDFGEWEGHEVDVWWEFFGGEALDVPWGGYEADFVTLLCYEFG